MPILKSYTTFRLGGYVRRVITARSAHELVLILKKLTRVKEPFFIMGGGTNIIASDQGYDGTIIRLRGGRIRVRGRRVVCDAGVRLERIVNTANLHGLMGLETLAGIPGTVGGAIFGNAGAYGREISESLRKLDIWNGKKVRALPRSQCGFEYRGSIFKKKPWVILRAEFLLKKGSAEELQKKSREIITLRRKKYRPGLRCAGSIFKNIPVGSTLGRKLIKKVPAEKIIGEKIPAGYLLESVGARGMRRSGISVAKHHGNLIVNNGRGMARDARALIEKLKKRVRKKFEITLEEEVRYLGFF